MDEIFDIGLVIEDVSNLLRAKEVAEDARVESGDRHGKRGVLRGACETCSRDSICLNTHGDQAEQR